MDRRRPGAALYRCQWRCHRRQPGAWEREIAQAVYDQIISHHYIHPTMFTTPAVEALSERLAQLAPGTIERFYFMTSGSEAVETAVKLARQIRLANSRPKRIKVVSRWKSYHGLTIGALSVTGRTIFRKPFTPLCWILLTNIPHALLFAMLLRPDLSRL